MHVVIWVLQILLALAFVAAGLTKLTQPRQKLATTMGWVEDFSDPGVRAIGALELLGGEAELRADEARHRLGDHLAGLDQPARVAERAELQGEAEPVPGAAPVLDGRELGLAQGVMPRELGPVGGGEDEVVIEALVAGAHYGGLTG